MNNEHSGNASAREIKTVGYVYANGLATYFHVSTGKTETNQNLPERNIDGLYLFVDETLTVGDKKSIVFSHPHNVVSFSQSVDGKDTLLFDPKNALLVIEHLKYFKPPPTTLSAVSSTDLLCVNSDVARLITRELHSENIRAPEMLYPELISLDEKEHVLLKIEDWYETLAILVSRDNYTPHSTPNLLKAWLRGNRGSKKICFQKYFVSLLYAIGLPHESVVQIVENSGLVLTRSGLEWITNRSQLVLSSVCELMPNSFVIRLGKWGGPAPARVIDCRVIPYEKPVITTVTPFVEGYIVKALSGGDWVASIETRNLASVQTKQKPSERNPTMFYKKLYECMWEKSRYIFNETEFNHKTKQQIDTRHRHEKLLDFAWKASLCITLTEEDPSSGHQKYINVPWATCCIYSLSRTAIETAALTHLVWVMDRSQIDIN